jgi:hypothetical protein
MEESEKPKEKSKYTLSTEDTTTHHFAQNERGELGFITSFDELDGQTVYIGIPVVDSSKYWISFNPTIFKDKVALNSIMEMSVLMTERALKNKSKDKKPNIPIKGSDADSMSCFIIGPKGVVGPSSRDGSSINLPEDISQELDELFRGLFNGSTQGMAPPNADEFELGAEGFEDLDDNTNDFK